MEYVIMKNRSLSKLVEDLESKFGKSEFQRLDFHADRPVSDRAAWTESVSKKVSHSKSGKKIKGINTMDGVKITLENDAWLLLRPSGTEPLIRLYSEAPKKSQAKELLQWGQEICGFKTKK
jgi:phosphomannomutase